MKIFSVFLVYIVSVRKYCYYRMLCYNKCILILGGFKVMPVIKLPKGVTPEDVESSMPFTVGIGAPYISNIPGPIRQIVQQAIKEGKDPAKVVASYLRGPYAPSKEAAKSFAGKGETVVSPNTTGAPQPSSGLKELGGLLGILALLFSAKSSSQDTTRNLANLSFEGSYPTDQTQGAESLKDIPSADVLVKQFTKRPIGNRAVKAIRELAQAIKPEDSIEIIESKALALDQKYYPEIYQEQPFPGGEVSKLPITQIPTEPLPVSTEATPLSITPTTTPTPTSTTPAIPTPVPTPIPTPAGSTASVEPSPTPVETLPSSAMGVTQSPPIEPQPAGVTPQQEFDAGFEEATRSREKILQDFLNKFAGYK